MAKLKKFKTKKFYIGVDVGGTKISAAIVDPSIRILLRSKHPAPRSPKPSIVGRQIEKLIRGILAEAKLSRKSLRGIGVGIPGIVDPKSNKILVTPNIALTGYPLAQRLKDGYRNAYGMLQISERHVKEGEPYKKEEKEIFAPKIF